MFLFCFLVCLGGVDKADDVICLHLGIRRSWLIVLSIILGVSSVVHFVGVYVMPADCRF